MSSQSKALYIAAEPSTKWHRKFDSQRGQLIWITFSFPSWRPPHKIDRPLPSSSNSPLATTRVSSCLCAELIAWWWLCGWRRRCIEVFMWLFRLPGYFSCHVLTGSISYLTSSGEHVLSHLREIFSENSLWYKYKFVFFTQHGKFSASENCKRLGRIGSCLIWMYKKPTKTSSLLHSSS